MTALPTTVADLLELRETTLAAVSPIRSRFAAGTSTATDAATIEALADKVEAIDRRVHALRYIQTPAASASTDPDTFAHGYVELSDQDQRIVRTCFHEAGHLIAAVLDGATPTAAKVLRSRVTGIDGFTRYQRPDDGFTFADKHPTVTVAGVWAEHYALTGTAPSVTQLRAALAGTHDGKDVDDYRARNPHRDPVAEFDRLGRSLVTAWSAVVEVAGKLVRESTATAADAEAALRLPTDPDARGFALSLIASGTPPRELSLTAAGGTR